jgi:diacylglycerol O-acyltransferase 1
MATNVHTIVAEARDITSKGVSIVDPPPGPNGVTEEEKPETKVRSRYRHVAALHSSTRPSCLSHESKQTPSFLGFRNLMVLTIIVMNLRLVVENAKKYGLLITLKFNVRDSDLTAGLSLYALTPCHLFVAYIIERVAMEHAKGAVGRRKKSDGGLAGPETEKEKKDFYNTWWWIAVAHTLNATLALMITSVTVYYGIHNPGIGSLCELHAIIVWLKTCSYAFTNRDLRHAMLHPGGPQSALPEIYNKCPYPRNITLGNLCYFWWAPTLVYQPYYPRTERIRWTFFFKRVGETLALIVFIWFTCAQYAEPVLRNSLDKMAVLDFPSIIERLMKLSTISLVVWLAGFFALFQSFLNALAEILRFGDRQFYEDWWNSNSLKMYWSTWNKPVYHFMRRHIYSPLLGRGWSPQAASLWVFVFSGFLHELVVGVPAHSILGIAFLGMVMQLPLIFITEPLSKGNGKTGKVIGNCIFWINFVFVGQPLAAMIYFFSWQAKYGALSQSKATGGSGTTLVL